MSFARTLMPGKIIPANKDCVKNVIFSGILPKFDVRITIYSMKTDIHCIPCILKQALRISTVMEIDEEKQKDIISEAMKVFDGNDLDKSTPYYTGRIWNIIKNHTNAKDPYKDIRLYYNEKMMEKEILMRENIAISSNPFRAAVKLAITGNIIDFGGRHDIDETLIMREIDRKRSRTLYIDHHRVLRNKIMKSAKLMYLGDNCGEIIFDKLLIEEILKANPEIEITYVVRGAPIINDIIMDDALQVGMNKLARVIDNGYDGPGTDLESCTPEFTKEFNEAEVIISKGQGNLESLIDTDHKALFFLLMVKCEAIARRVNAKMGSLICLHKDAGSA